MAKWMQQSLRVSRWRLNSDGAQPLGAARSEKEPAKEHRVNEEGLNVTPRSSLSSFKLVVFTLGSGVC